MVDIGNLRPGARGGPEPAPQNRGRGRPASRILFGVIARRPSRPRV